MDISDSALQSAKILSEIYERAQDLSEEEQRFILDIIKSYSKHRKDQ